MGKTGGGPARLPAQLSQVNLNAAGVEGLHVDRVGRACGSSWAPQAT